jgi:hypothetical protein
MKPRPKVRDQLNRLLRGCFGLFLLWNTRPGIQSGLLTGTMECLLIGPSRARVREIEALLVKSIVP